MYESLVPIIACPSRGYNLSRIPTLAALEKPLP